MQRSVLYIQLLLHTRAFAAYFGPTNLFHGTHRVFSDFKSRNVPFSSVLNLLLSKILGGDSMEGTKSSPTSDAQTGICQSVTRRTIRVLHRSCPIHTTRVNTGYPLSNHPSTSKEFTTYVLKTSTGLTAVGEMKAISRCWSQDPRVESIAKDLRGAKWLLPRRSARRWAVWNKEISRSGHLV